VGDQKPLDGGDQANRQEGGKEAVVAAQLLSEGAARLAGAEVAAVGGGKLGQPLRLLAKLFPDLLAAEGPRFGGLGKGDPRPHQQRLHGGNGGLHRLGDLLVGEVVQLPQQQRGPLALGKLADVLDEMADTLLLEDPIAYRLGVGAQVDVHRVDAGGRGAAQLVEAAVAGDPVKPRPDVDRPIVGNQGVVGGDEYLLQDVLGVLLAAQHVSAEGKEPGAVPLDQDLEGPLVAGPGQGNQPLLGGKPQQLLGRQPTDQKRLFSRLRLHCFLYQPKTVDLKKLRFARSPPGGGRYIADMAAPTTTEQTRFHGGRLVARRLKAHGLGPLFTLSGGHLFSIYDGCVKEGIPIVDVRHEATAAFAAEGWSKATRRLGVCALTAGPGVTNGMSALAQAQANESPLLVLGGRAPAGRWGQGSLQEIDHIPFVAPLCRFAKTAGPPQEIPTVLEQAIAAATAPRGGPAFVDFPLDYVFMEGEEQLEEEPGSPQPLLQGDLEAVAELLRGARRPVVMAGSGLYWGCGEEELCRLIEALEIPAYTNGLARGCVPADHPLYFSRTRGRALREADVALVVGVPLDFRLGFGNAFGEQTKLVLVDRAPFERAAPRQPHAELYGPLPELFKALREACAGARRSGAEEQLTALREEERRLREAERGELADERAPLHPMRIYGELANFLTPQTTVVCDGGDFASYAGRLIDCHQPGRWLDPGPYGCLGAGPGYALAAALADPGNPVVLLLGDGAFGFSGLEFDTLIRHKAKVVAIVGNNGIWGLEKHPMEFVYGYSVAADLRPATRYDLVVSALGGHGELVERPDQLRGALERAFAAEGPALVNVLTDPTIAYPRKANLA